MRKIIIGIDEVGRGSWLGPLHLGAVCFIKPPRVPRGVFIVDSKKIDHKKRVVAARFIKKKGIFTTFLVPYETVDVYGVHRATIRGLHAIIKKIKRKIIKILFLDQNRAKFEMHFVIDGRRICTIDESHEFIISGDSKVLAISAASIIAKTTRDRLMVRYSRIYPGYSIEKHMGYGTKKHQEALSQRGVLPIHRTSFKPIQEYIKTYPQGA